MKFLTQSIFALLVLFGFKTYADQSFLCERIFDDQVGFTDQIKSPLLPSGTISTITWNAQKFENSKFFFDLKKLSENTDLIFLQEAKHSENWQKAFASHMPFSWNFFKSFCLENKKATGIQTGARYPLLNNRNIVSPVTEPVTFTPKVSGLSQVEVPGYGPITLVNTHALNFNTGDDFQTQISHLAEELQNYQGPMIWAGDFNTWDGARLRFLLQKTKELGLTHIQHKNDKRLLVLDHVFVRGLDFVSSEILNYNSSDHKPIRSVFKFIPAN